jgi:hypothetical protein
MGVKVIKKANPHDKKLGCVLDWSQVEKIHKMTRNMGECYVDI